jgi:hypothetical protein
MPRVYHQPRNLDEFFAEAMRHNIADLVVKRHGALFNHNLTHGRRSEPVYSVRNSIETLNGKLNYGFQSHIIPIRNSFIDLPQCRASIDEFVNLVKTARERQFCAEVRTSENHNKDLVAVYPHFARELKEYQLVLERAMIGIASF